MLNISQYKSAQHKYDEPACSMTHLSSCEQYFSRVC